jgi:cytidylate kinase
MNKNEKFVITINRELGSGGRTVGEKLAERLGVSFYDKALIKALEEKYHLTVEEIEKLKGQKNNWWSDFKRVVSVGGALHQSVYYQVPVGSKSELLTTADLFNAETEILEGIAENESCVIAGRCGFFVFRNHPNHLSILILAPLEYRIQRVMRKKGLSHEEAEKIIRQVDRMRENYVTKYTNSSRYDARNYNIVISSDERTEEEIADLIVRYIG